MSEGGIERRLHLRQSTDREAQLKRFLDDGGFDRLNKVSPEKPLKRGDRVVTRENAAIGTVHEVTGESVSVNFEGETVSGRKTVELKDVRRAEDYEEALRKQSR